MSEERPTELEFLHDFAVLGFSVNIIGNWKIESAAGTENPELCE